MARARCGVAEAEIAPVSRDRGRGERIARRESARRGCDLGPFISRHTCYSRSLAVGLYVFVQLSTGQYWRSPTGISKMKTSLMASKQNAEAQQSRNAAGWLGLAASPTFALMAWISASDVQAMMCSSAPGGFPIDSMALMYLLMSFFHLSPWLRLTSSRPWQLTYPATHRQGD